MSGRVKYDEDGRCVCCGNVEGQCGRQVAHRLRMEADAERKRVLALPGVFAANYAGSCAGCSARFEESTPIRSAEGKGYLGACCL